MADGPQRGVAHDVEPAPRLFKRPSDAPPPLDHVASSETLQALRRELASQSGEHTASLRRTARGWAGRISGRSRRRLFVALDAATVALAERCDTLTDRLAAQAEVTEDVAATLGEELTRLRAEVLHLRTLNESLVRRADD